MARLLDRIRHPGAAAWLVGGVVALGAATFPWVRQTNFRGFDEWVIFSLLSRGILSFPYANRPLCLVWALPAWWLAPDRLWGFLVIHAAWLTLGGVLVGILVRRLLPGRPALAFLAASFAVVWVPSDLTRLATVQMTLYSGCTAGTLLALWLLVEGWSRRRPALAVIAAGVAALTLLSIEAPLLLLAVGPGLLGLVGGPRELARWARWSLGWLLLLAGCGWRILGAIAGMENAVAYQTGVHHLSRSPWHLAGRVLTQFRHHLVRLGDGPTQELAVAAVPVVVVVFAAGFFLATRRPSKEVATEPTGRRAMGVACLAGLTCAVLAYLPFVASAAIRGPVRTQFLSAPGVGLALAAAVSLLASLLPIRVRHLATFLMGAWVVAVGTGRTVALQEVWNTTSQYGAQRRTLLDLTTLAPDVEPRTFFVMLQRDRAWPFDFTFTHAVRYLYEGRAQGHASDSVPLLYGTRFDTDAVVWEPLPVLRAWGDETVRYRYDELVICREDAQGRLTLLESWPDDLPPLPPGARYAPRERIRAQAPSPRRLVILDPVPPRTRSRSVTPSGG